MKIVLFATSEFAIPTLETIYNSKHQILAVYTKEGKEQGRGLKVKNTPIYEKAQILNIPTYTPKTLKSQEEIEKLKKMDADIFVVVAYGLLLPKEILNIAKFGCINIHPSLLPRWRGASPLQRALMNGDEKTGVCIIIVGEGLDDGNILIKKEYDIKQNTTLQILHDDLSKIGSDLMLNCLNDIEKNNKITSYPQDTIGIMYAKKIEKEEGKIDFNKSIKEIDCLIRALSSTVGTYFEYKGERIKILDAKLIETENYNNFKNGEFINNKLTIKCSNGILEPLILQREGKKTLNVKEFLNGFKF